MSWILWMFLGYALAIATGVLWCFSVWTRRCQGRWRQRRSLCANCGYDIRQLTGAKCPECGEVWHRADGPVPDHSDLPAAVLAVGRWFIGITGALLPLGAWWLLHVVGRHEVPWYLQFAPLVPFLFLGGFLFGIPLFFTLGAPLLAMGHCCLLERLVRVAQRDYPRRAVLFCGVLAVACDWLVFLQMSEQLVRSLD